MLTNLQTRKLDRAFAHMDVNRNGVVQLEDLLALASRAMNAFDVTPDSSKGKRILDAYSGFWDALVRAIDRDANGKITPEEWRAGMDGAFIADEGGFEQGMRPAVDATVDLMDTDGSGALSIKEFRTLQQQAFQTAPKDIDWAFAQLDTDGDKTLSVKELCEAARQFYVGGEENVPGNCLYGPI